MSFAQAPGSFQKFMRMKAASWDLSEKNLYVNPVFGFDFGLGDVDEGGMSQNLMLDRLSYKIELRDKIDARPETVALIDESVDLHVIFYLEWP